MSKNKPIIKTTIKSICAVSLWGIFVRQFLCKLLSKDLLQTLYLLKFHAFSIFLWTPLDGCAWGMIIILRDASYFKHSNKTHTAKASLQKRDFARFFFACPIWCVEANFSSPGLSGFFFRKRHWNMLKQIAINTYSKIVVVYEYLKFIPFSCIINASPIWFSFNFFSLS